MILACTCSNAYQDSLYGKGRRVHSQTKQQQPATARQWRCSVCGVVRSGPAKPEKVRDE